MIVFSLHIIPRIMHILSHFHRVVCLYDMSIGCFVFMCLLTLCSRVCLFDMSGLCIVGCVHVDGDILQRCQGENFFSCLELKLTSRTICKGYLLIAKMFSV